MIPQITIAYVTSRLVPRWEWYADSIVAQTTPEQRENIQFVFVDGHLWRRDTEFVGFSEIALADVSYHEPERRRELEQVVAKRFDYLHVPPKPCAWQGPFRQTKNSWFCAANSRNTVFVVARTPYVTFVDDLSVLMPGWFNQVLHAAQDGYVVAGAYKKAKQLKVVNGLVESFEPYPPGIDSRWVNGSDGGVVPWRGSGLFGCSFGVPLEAALEVDGNDAACNGAGAEDTDFGLRLDRAGWAFFYNRNMLSLESEEDHHTEPALPRESKLVTPDRLPPGYEGNPMSDHVMLNRVCRETERILPLIGDNLRSVRERYLATGFVPVPQEPQFDWRDGTPLAEL